MGFFFVFAGIFCYAYLFLNSIYIVPANKTYLMIFGALLILIGAMMLIFSALKVTEPTANIDVWDEEKDLNNNGYKIFLTKKYGIEKSEALGKIICKDELFENINDALLYANDLENEFSSVKVNNDGTWTCPKSGHKNPLPIGKCNYCSYISSN